MSDDHLLMCCCCRAAHQYITEEKNAEIARLRLTPKEREAVEWYAAYGAGHHADTLRKLLERNDHDAVPDAIANADGEPAPKCGGEAGLSSRDGTGNTHTLTDAEREAVELFASLNWTSIRWSAVEKHAAALRKLLERLGGGK